jgi:hypothetical protein
LFLAWPRVLKPIRKICEISPKRGLRDKNIAVCTENLNPDIMVMKSVKNRV